MKFGIWHHTADQNPEKSGYYLTYRGWGMGGPADDEHDYGYLWYDKRNDIWREYQSQSAHSAIVYYWTDADPSDWVENDPPITQRRRYVENVHPAEQEAWNALQEALKQYQTIKALCAKNEL